MWYKMNTLLYQHGHKISQNERTEYSASNHSLIIKNIQSDDASQYYCKVLPHNISMRAGLEIIPMQTAYVYSFDGRDVSDRTITYHEGDRIEVFCKGSPESGRPKWFSDGNPLQNDQNTEIDGGKLIIKKAKRDNIRLYQCLVDSNSGNDVGQHVQHTSVTINIQCE